MFSPLRSWFAPKPRSRTSPARARLGCEHLEDRSVPAANFAWGDMSSYAELTSDPGTALVKDYANDLAADGAGNRYVLGLSQSSNSDARVYHVAKYNAADNSLAWVTTFGGGGSNYTTGGAVTVDGAGNVYAALPTYTGTPGPVTIVKLNPTGGVEQTYTESRGTADWSDNGHVIDLATDAAGSVYYTAAGYTVRLESQPGGLVKVDDYGRGGYAIAVAPDGQRVYVTGRFSGVVDFDPTRSYADGRDVVATQKSGKNYDTDVFILELNRNALTGKMEFAWVGKVGGTAGDMAEDIAVDGSGVYVLGAYPSSTTDTNTSTDFDPGAGRYSLPVYAGSEHLTGGIFLLKLDSANQFQWVKGIVGNGSSGDSASGRGRLALDGAGGVYVSDVFEGPWGDFDIEASYPGNIDRVPGSSGSFQNQLFAAKYTANGAFEWAATITGTGHKAPQGLAVTAGGVHVLSTVARDTLTVTPGGAQFAADPNGDLFLATFTESAGPPTLSVSDASVIEGGNGTGTQLAFTVTRSGDLSQTATADYTAANGTAAAGTDYAATAGAVTFAPGETTKTVVVIVYGDIAVEANETVTLTLNNAAGATITRGAGVGTIVNDDVPTPALSIGNVNKSEGRSGVTLFTFTVTLSAPSATGVWVNWTTAGGTATVGTDFKMAGGTLYFAPGATTATITVEVYGDRTRESDEVFYIDLLGATGADIANARGVGTILNDD